MLFQKVLTGNRWKNIKMGPYGRSRTDSYGNMEMYLHKRKIRKKKKSERSDSHRPSGLLPSPICRSGTVPSEKVSLRASLRRMKRAGLTLETAMVLPLFLLGMITMISFMDIYKLQTEHLVKLCEKAKQAGMYVYSPDGNGMEEITLPDVYVYHPVGGIAPLPSIWLHTTVKVHAWTGKEAESASDGGAEEEGEEMVFVTENGSVYHKNPGCSYLNLSVSQVGGNAVETMTNEYGEHYQACELCSRNQKPGGTVYVTASGNRYHNLESCSGLKRTVRLVKHSQVEGMSPCRRCGRK